MLFILRSETINQKSGSELILHRFLFSKKFMNYYFLPLAASVSACFKALDIPTETIVSSGVLITA